MLNRAQSASQAPSRGSSDPQISAAEEAEYAALEATLRSSELGRRFLADYARQHPTPEVKLLLDVVSRLETGPQDSERRCHTHGLVSELVAMSETIRAMRQEIGTLCLPDGPDGDPLAAPCAFDQILEASARATSDVLVALEEMQTVSSTLREKGVAVEYCDRLDERAVDIYTACARREIAGQQTGDALNLLRDMERRIDALIEDWSDQETQHLMTAAMSLDVSEAFAKTAPRAGTLATDRTEAGGQEHARKTEVIAPVARRTNRLVPEEDRAAHVASADAPPAETPRVDAPLADTPSKKAPPFDPPAPLTLETLHATQRATLFG